MTRGRVLHCGSRTGIKLSCLRYFKLSVQSLSPIGQKRRVNQPCMSYTGLADIVQAIIDVGS